MNNDHTVLALPGWWSVAATALQRRARTLLLVTSPARFSSVIRVGLVADVGVKVSVPRVAAGPPVAAQRPGEAWVNPAPRHVSNAMLCKIELGC